MDISSQEENCETIVCYMQDPISKTVGQRPRDNQRERGITNKIGDPRNKIYHNFIQALINWDKKLLDKVKENYSHVTISQTSDLKEKLEEIGIERYEVTIASIDAINMYPSIKIAKIKKYVELFFLRLTAVTNNTINLCL